MDELLDTRPKPGLGDFHLRSALTPLSLEDLNSGKARTNTLKAYRSLKLSERELKVGQPAKLLGRLLADCVGYSLSDKKPQKWDMLIRVTEAEMRRNNLTHGGETLLNKFSEKIRSSSIKFSSYPYYFAIFSLLVSASNALVSGREVQKEFFYIGKEKHGLYSYIINKDLKFLLAGELFVVKLKNKSYLYSLDVLRMISDKIAERNNILLASEISSDHLPEVYLPQTSVLQLFSVVDQFLIKHINNAYKLIKHHEPFCWGLLLSRSGDRIVDKDSFLNEIKMAACEDFPKEDVDEYISKIDKICSSPHHLSQIAGLFREWGHPVVDPIVGFEQVRKFGNAEKREDNTYPKIAGWKAKEIFFSNYFRHHGQYPPFKQYFPEDQLDSSLSLSLIGDQPLNTKDLSYSLSSWEYVIPEQCFPIPETFNLSLIVSDTAISPTRTEIAQANDSKSILKPEVRRGVLKFIKDGVIDCQTLLKDVNDNEKGLDDDHLIIGLYPKEREINPKARMFALMSLIMRAYIVVTEEMLSGILKYFPGITMTDDLLSLTKKMVTYTNASSGNTPGSRRITINSDFIKWNLNFRKWATFFVFLFLGQIFGLPNLFNRTYDIFFWSIVYLADGSFLPNIDEMLNLLLTDEERRAYTGHLGGFEGLRQKGWTIFTVVVIAYICDKLNLDYHLMGQGDNQVIVITIYSEREKILGYCNEEIEKEYRDKLAEFMREFQAIFDCLGLPLKVSETWTSESLFLYGKIPIYKGISLANSYKRLSRIFPFSNEDLMTLDNAMSAISANAITAAGVDVQPYTSLILAKWHHILCVTMFCQYHPLKGQPMIQFGQPCKFSIKIEEKLYRFQNNSPLSFSDTILSLVFSSKSLGGTNGINESQLIMRGFPDAVSRDLDNLYWLIFSNISADPLISKIAQNWMKVKLSPGKKRTMLVEDPTALNLLVPPQTLSITRKVIKENIKQAPSTSEFGDWFKELMAIGDEPGRADFLERLTRGDTVFPRLSHEVYAASLYGYSESIVSKVDKTVTLSRISMSHNNLDIVGILLRGEDRYLHYLWWRAMINTESDVEISSPVSQYAQRVRDLGWGAKIEAVTVPFPSQFLVKSLCNPSFSHNPGPGMNYFSVAVSELVSTVGGRIYMFPGKSPPYLGSSTSEKLYGKNEKTVYGVEPLIRRPVNLARLLGWIIFQDSNYSQLIKDLISSVTDEDPQEFIRHIERPSGSAAHRLKDSATEHGAMYNLLPSPVSHMTMSSENLFDYGKGSVNVNLHFQACLCYIQHVVSQMIINGGFADIPIRSVHFHFRTQAGLELVLDNVPDLQEPIPKELIPTRPTNPYLFVTKDKIKFMATRFSALRNTARILPEGALEEMTDVQKRLIIRDNLAIKISFSILSSKSDRSGDADIFDIQSINRFYPKKISSIELLRQIYSFLYMSIFQDAFLEDPTSFPTATSVKRKVIRLIATCKPSALIDLVPIVSDSGSRALLQESDLFSIPLSYPLTSKSLCLSARSTLRNFVWEETETPFSQCIGVLVDPLSEMCKLLINHLLISKAAKSTKGCYYCVKTICNMKIHCLNDLKSIYLSHCDLGHETGRRFVSSIKWGIIKCDLSSLIKSTPSDDPFVSEVVRDNIPDLDWVSYEILWTKRDNKNRWSESKQEAGGLFPMHHNVHSTYNLFGLHKIPTNGYVRVLETLFIATKLKMIPRELKGSEVLVLGDGFGYSSSAAGDLYGRGVTAWSYIRVDESCPHMLDLSNPPSHEILRLTDEIFSYPSRTLESDITSDLWLESKQLIEREAGRFKLIISEIELFYVDSGEQSYFGYLKNLKRSRVDHLVIRLKYFNPKMIHLFMSEISTMYQDCVIIRGAVRSGGTNDFWMVAKGLITLEKTQEKWLSKRVAEDLFAKWGVIIESNIPCGEESPGYCRRIDSATWSLNYQRFYEDYIKTWFSEAGLSSWDSNVLTGLWYELETSRRPISMSNDTGRARNYLFSDMASKIKTRLIALMFSRCSDGLLTAEFGRVHEWKLYWLRVRSSIINPNKNWTVALLRGEISIPKRVVHYQVSNPESETDLLKIIPYLREKREWSKFTQLGNMVIFRYDKQLVLGQRSSSPEDLWDDAEDFGEFDDLGNYVSCSEEWINKPLEKDLFFPVSKRVSYLSCMFNPADQPRKN